MSELLTDLLAAGLIENLGGNDDRFAKIEKAATVVAKELGAKPPMLIRAILAGLDPDVSANDPAIAQAEKALSAEWKTMRSVYPDAPIGLYRTILLEACNQAAHGTNAAILWLTAADTLPLLRVGKEEVAVRRMLEMLAERTEEAALIIPPIADRADAGQREIKLNVSTAENAPTPRKVNREALKLRVAAAAGPNYRNQPNLSNPNPYWSNTQMHWSWEFTDRMHAVLADELDNLAGDIGKQQADVHQQFQALQSQLAKALQNELSFQQRWIQEALEASEERKQAKQLRLNVLWWSQALYSQSLRCAYRELPMPLAAIIMALDLLDQVTKPTPASVGYLLAETVHRLLNEEANQKQKLSDLLGTLRESRSRLPRHRMAQFIDPPKEGRLSLRDVILLALGDQDFDPAKVLKRAGLVGDVERSLPELAHALFRQEQAMLLAKGTK